ncbi:MAG: CsgG/HfaB family protein, partial [Spirochaetaceae bacterium]|nr:CsgG/HfaB family protein [Spirochaetaceae bacterium]
MKITLVISAVVTLAVFSGCQTGGAVFGGGNSGDIPNMQEVLQEAYQYMKGKVPRGSKIAFLNITSGDAAQSSEIIDELIYLAVEDRNASGERPFTVVTRQNLEEIQREMNFQLSGEVSDKSAQSIGQKLGAQTVISGSVTRIGNLYRLRLRALGVETAEVQGLFIKNGYASGSSRIPADSLDEEIRNARQYLSGRLASGITLVVMAQSSYTTLREYISDQLTMELVETGKFTVLDRYNLQVIQEEMNFQLSGEVSDSSMQAIGEKLGAQFIILAKLDKSGSSYRLNVSALVVENATVEAMERFTVSHSYITEQLTSLEEQHQRADAQAEEERRRQAAAEANRLARQGLETRLGAYTTFGGSLNPGGFVFDADLEAGYKYFYAETGVKFKSPPEHQGYDKLSMFAFTLGGGLAYYGRNWYLSSGIAADFYSATGNTDLDPSSSGYSYSSENAKKLDGFTALSWRTRL